MALEVVQRSEHLTQLSQPGTATPDKPLKCFWITIASVEEVVAEEDELVVLKRPDHRHTGVFLYIGIAVDQVPLLIVPHQEDKARGGVVHAHIDTLGAEHGGLSEDVEEGLDVADTDNDGAAVDTVGKEGVAVVQHRLGDLLILSERSKTKQTW